MKMLKTGITLIAVSALAGSVVFAHMERGDETYDKHLQMLLEENDMMMDMLHEMMDRFEEMESDDKGRQEMEEMMREMAQLRMNHRMDMMIEKNGQTMELMHRVTGHLEGMPMDEAGKREMGKMKKQMGRMMKKD